MPKRTRSHDETLNELLADPEQAAAYLEESLALGRQEFLLALRDVVRVRGGMTRLAKKSGQSRESLYRALSEAGNPSIETMLNVLPALGLRLSIAPV